MHAPQKTTEVEFANSLLVNNYIFKTLPWFCSFFVHILVDTAQLFASRAGPGALLAAWTAVHLETKRKWSNKWSALVCWGYLLVEVGNSCGNILYVADEGKCCCSKIHTVLHAV